MLKKFFQNARKPEGLMGRLFVRAMNSGHAKLSEWGFSQLPAQNYSHILDVGCGGGANIAKMLRTFPGSIVDGLDYSEASVTLSRKLNAGELGKRCSIRQGEVSNLPYVDQSLDLVTAFETTYFWPSLETAFKEIKRVLKPGGLFFICCAVDDPDDQTWTDRIDGMTIHRAEDLKALLLKTGLGDVETRRHEKGWICVKAVAGDQAAA